MLAISKTPYRISFFGGGTDYPAWFEAHGGAVLGTTIDHYCYVACLPKAMGRKNVAHLHDWQTLEEHIYQKCQMVFPHHDLDGRISILYRHGLPRMSGMGSSSSLTVGLLNSVGTVLGETLTKMELGQKSIMFEQKLLKEYVGCQDQLSVAFGGMNHIEFRPCGRMIVNPLPISTERKEQLLAHLMLFYTGVARPSSLHAKHIIQDIPFHTNDLFEIMQMVNEAKRILCSSTDLSELGILLHESWKIKRSLSKRMTNGQIDEAYNIALKAGALGGKLLGAGGGGFLLFFVPPERRSNVKKALANFRHHSFQFEEEGSQIFRHNGLLDKGNYHFEAEYA